MGSIRCVRVKDYVKVSGFCQGYLIKACVRVRDQQTGRLPGRDKIRPGIPTSADGTGRLKMSPGRDGTGRLQNLPGRDGPGRDDFKIRRDGTGRLQISSGRDRDGTNPV